MTRIQNRRRPLLSALLIAGLAVVAWRSRWFAGGGAAGAEPPVATEENGVARLAARERLSAPAMRESGAGPASPDGPGASPRAHALAARVALATERLRAWEDNDEPELRAKRTEELEALLAVAGPDRWEIIAALPPALMDFAFGLPSFQAWTAAEPKAAAEWMRAHPAISEARLVTLLQNWGEKNRGEMHAYVADLPPGAWREKALAAAANLAMAVDPVEAIAWARLMSVDGRRTGLLEAATVAWAKRDPDAAAQWVKQLDDPELRQPLAGAWAVGYAEVDPVLAAERALQTVRPGAVLDHTLAEIAGAWAKYEPAAVARWVEQFADGPGREMALGHVVNAWANRDRAAATAWVAGLRDAGMRSQAARMLAALPERPAQP